MTNSNRLRDKIKECGYKRTFIAQSLGLTLQGYLNKEQNVPGSEFRASEIIKLQELLGLSDNEVREIFFAQMVN